jgi:hypothetical protein
MQMEVCEGILEHISRRFRPIALPPHICFTDENAEFLHLGVQNHAARSGHLEIIRPFQRKGLILFSKRTSQLLHDLCNRIGLADIAGEHDVHEVGPAAFGAESPYRYAWQDLAEHHGAAYP